MSDDKVHFEEKDRWLAKLNRHGSGGPPSSDTPSTANSERLARLEGAFDSYQKSLTVLVVLVTFLGAIMIAGFTITYGQVARVDGQIERLGTKTDALPQRLVEEFRFMRAEMSAQTSALATAVTAARGSPPQIVVVPGPQPPGSPNQ